MRDDLHGLSREIDKHLLKIEKVKKALKFSTDWIECVHLDENRFTNAEYKQFLNDLKNIEKGV